MSKKAPKHLEKWGASFWEQLVDDYGITDAAGQQLVTTASECLDRMRNAQALIKKHGECFKDRYGGLKSNPALKAETDARNGLLSCLRMLNLDLEPLRDHPGRPTR